MSTYPAPMKFDLPPGATRDKVLAAAAKVGLRVKYWDATVFLVFVTAPMDAYYFGLECGPDTCAPVAQTRRIDLEDLDG
jgi:hypothetical protein